MSVDDRIRRSLDEAKRLFADDDVPAFREPAVRGPLVAAIAAVTVGIAITVAAVLVRIDPVIDRVGTETAQIATSAPTTTTASVADETMVSPLRVEQPVPLRIFTIGPDAVAVLDLEEASTTIYPERAYPVPSRGDGAVVTPRRDLILWTYEPAARVFTGPLDHVDLELRPEPARDIAGIAPAMRVVPTPNGDAIWMVQPGIGYGDLDHPTLIELIEMPTGRRLGRFETEPNSFPVAATDTGLVLNTDDLVDTGDGWVTDPGTEHVTLLTESGTTVDIGPGNALAASSTTIAIIECPPTDQADCDLYLADSEGAHLGSVARPDDGVWSPVGGPRISSEASPLQTVSPDGTQLLVALGQASDENGTPASSTMYAVDLTRRTTRQITSMEGRYPLATWSADGEWIAVIDDRDVLLIDESDPAATNTVVDALPTEHFPFAAG